MQSQLKWSFLGQGVLGLLLHQHLPPGQHPPPAREQRLLPSRTSAKMQPTDQVSMAGLYLAKKLPHSSGALHADTHHPAAAAAADAEDLQHSDFPMQADTTGCCCCCAARTDCQPCTLQPTMAILMLLLLLHPPTPLHCNQQPHCHRPASFVLSTLCPPPVTASNMY